MPAHTSPHFTAAKAKDHSDDEYTGGHESGSDFETSARKRGGKAGGRGGRGGGRGRAAPTREMPKRGGGKKRL
jgi:hypothetical protein